MLAEAGARLVIVGHSERRADQHETDAEVRAKAEAALAPRPDRDRLRRRERGPARCRRGRGGRHRQLAGSLPESWDGAELVVAYEPIWAIGTGKVATPADVAEMHAAIRALLTARFGDTGAAVRILYGGSVKPDNAAELFAWPTSTAPWSAAPA